MKPYLKYIFEILAIVIGITLSFIVDEWREERQEMEKIKFKLKELVESLESDKRQLDDFRAMSSFRHASLQYLLKQAELPQYNPDGINIHQYQNDFLGWPKEIPDTFNIDFVRFAMAWSGRVGGALTINSKLFEEIESTGAFGKLNNLELKNQLKRYYSEVNWRLLSGLETYRHDWISSLMKNGIQYNDVWENPIPTLKSDPYKGALLKALTIQANWLTNSCENALWGVDSVLSQLKKEMVK